MTDEEREKLLLEYLNNEYPKKKITLAAIDHSSTLQGVAVGFLAGLEAQNTDMKPLWSQISAAETELASWANRWQDESDLQPLDIVGILECMKLQVYYKMAEADLDGGQDND